MFNIKFKRCIRQLKELLYKKQIDENTIIAASFLIKEGAELSEKGFFYKAKKEFFEESVLGMLGYANDHFMASHWATITGEETEDVLAWEESAKLKSSLYDSLCKKFNWLHTEKHKKNAERIMKFQSILKPKYAKENKEDRKKNVGKVIEVDFKKTDTLLIKEAFDFKEPGAPLLEEALMEARG